MRLYSTALVTAIFAVATSTAAFATDAVSDTNPRADAAPTATTNADGATTNATTSIGQDTANSRVANTMTYEDLSKMLNIYGTSGFDASILDTVQGGDLSVDVYKLSEVDGMTTQNMAAVAQLIADQQEHINMVQQDLENRGEIQAALQAAGFETSDVIVVQTVGNQQVTLVVNDAS